MPTLKAETKAPVFELPLMGGGTFSLQKALHDSAVVLAFFKISCPVCQYAFPIYERLSRTIADGVKIIGVSQDDESASRKFANTYGVTFPIALDDTDRYPVSNAYGLTNVPTVFEIAQDGQIVLASVGWDKAAVEDIYRRHANLSSLEKPMPLFPPAEAIADFRAG